VGYAAAVIGRGDELSAVRAVADAAVAGTASALLVSGEAGVGKTVLVRQAANDLARSADVMWVSCLPLTSLAVPLLRRGQVQAERRMKARSSTSSPMERP